MWVVKCAYMLLYNVYITYRNRIEIHDQVSLLCVCMCVCVVSIIVKLREHEEFFPAFHSLVLELLHTLGMNSLSLSHTHEQEM